MGSRLERCRRRKSLLRAMEFNAVMVPTRRFSNRVISTQYTSRFRQRFTTTGRVGQSMRANMCSVKSRWQRMRNWQKSWCCMRDDTAEFCLKACTFVSSTAYAVNANWWPAASSADCFASRRVPGRPMRLWPRMISAGVSNSEGRRAGCGLLCGQLFAVSWRERNPKSSRWSQMHAVRKSIVGCAPRFASRPGSKAPSSSGFAVFICLVIDVVVTCEKGRIKWDAEGLVLEKNGKEIHESLPTESTYRLQLEAFAKSVRGERSNALPPNDAVLTARVLDAIYEKAGLALRGTRQTS